MAWSLTILGLVSPRRVSRDRSHSLPADLLLDAQALRRLAAKVACLGLRQTGLAWTGLPGLA